MRHINDTVLYWGKVSAVCVALWVITLIVHLVVAMVPTCSRHYEGKTYTLCVNYDL